MNGSVQIQSLSTIQSGLLQLEFGNLSQGGGLIADSCILAQEKAPAPCNHPSRDGNKHTAELPCKSLPQHTEQGLSRFSRHETTNTETHSTVASRSGGKLFQNHAANYTSMCNTAQHRTNDSNNTYEDRGVLTNFLIQISSELEKNPFNSDQRHACDLGKVKKDSRG